MDVSVREMENQARCCLYNILKLKLKEKNKMLHLNNGFIYKNK